MKLRFAGLPDSHPRRIPPRPLLHRGGSGDDGDGGNDHHRDHGSDHDRRTPRRSAPRPCYRSRTRHFRHNVRNWVDRKTAGLEDIQSNWQPLVKAWTSGFASVGVE